MQTGTKPSRADAQEKEATDLTAMPRDRRILLHSVLEVRRNEVVNLRFGISLLPDADVDKNMKACILSAHYVSTIKTILPPIEKNFTRSDRYGYFVYIRSDVDHPTSEWTLELAVPYHAAQLVVTLMPFTIPNVRLTSTVIEVGPSAT